MGIFSKIKHHVKNITKGAKQRAQEERERIEKETEENAKQLGIEPGIGVVISNVKSGSPAEKSGLLPGMIVQEAERQAVSNIDTFKEIINDIDQGKGILLLIRTSNSSRYIFLQEN